jgi:hypothetical protein
MSTGTINSTACLVSASRAALAAGISIVPPKEDGTKRPDGQWKRFQEQPPTEAMVNAWYGPRLGLGFVCGAVSGGLELFEFDSRETYEQFREAAVAVGLGELVERIEAGYLEETPGDGIHWFYYCNCTFRDFLQVMPPD